MGIGRYVGTVAIAILILWGLPSAYAATGKADILHYSISLTLDPANGTVHGFTMLTINATDLEDLPLKLMDSLDLTSVELDGRTAEFSREGRNIIIPLDGPRYGVFDLRMEYNGTLDAEMNGHSWAYIDDENAYAVHESLWYPTIPGDRATATITIQQPAGWMGISNGELSAFDEKSRSYTWVVDTPEAGFSFAAGRYMEVQIFNKHLLVNCYLLAPKERCPENLNHILSFMTRELGDYPYEKLSLVEVKGNLNGGHGDHSLIIMSGDIIRGPQFREFLAHEISHNWFGGTVAPKDIESKKDHWLTEGFATYAGVLYLESIDTRLRDKTLAAKRREYVSFREKNDDEAIATAKDGYDEAFHAIVYSKGAWVLHMLRYVVGDDVFSKTIKSYVERYSGGSASIGDFQRVAEETSEMELGWFFEEWLNSTALPDFWISDGRVKKTGDSYNVTFIMREGGDVVKMPVDVTIHTAAGVEVTKRVWVDSAKTEFEFETSLEPIFLEIDKDGWLLEEEKSNNRYVLRYPLNLYGLRLFLTTLGARLSGVSFLHPRI